MGAIPTIEVARVSALADAFLQQWAVPFDMAEELAMHAALMQMIEPELARTAAARSSIAALRATVAELQALTIALAQPEPVVDWLRAMPDTDRQALNVQVAASVGRAGSLLVAIDRLGDTVLPWLAQRIAAGNLAPIGRNEVLAA